MPWHVLNYQTLLCNKSRQICLFFIHTEKPQKMIHNRQMPGHVWGAQLVTEVEKGRKKRGLYTHYFIKYLY